MTKLGERLIQSAKQARAIARGDAAPARVFTPPAVDVASLRKKLGLSQRKFALRYGFSPASVRDWEQLRRNPDPAARTLLTVIEKEPKAVDRALGHKAGVVAERIGRVASSAKRPRHPRRRQAKQSVTAKHG